MKFLNFPENNRKAIMPNEGPYRIPKRNKDSLISHVEKQGFVDNKFLKVLLFIFIIISLLIVFLGTMISCGTLFLSQNFYSYQSGRIIVIFVCSFFYIPKAIRYLYKELIGK